MLFAIFSDMKTAVNFFNYFKRKGKFDAKTKNKQVQLNTFMPMVAKITWLWNIIQVINIILKIIFKYKRPHLVLTFFISSNCVLYENYEYIYIYMHIYILIKVSKVSVFPSSLLLQTARVMTDDAPATISHHVVTLSMKTMWLRIDWKKSGPMLL